MLIFHQYSLTMNMNIYKIMNIRKLGIYVIQDLYFYK